MTHTQYAVRFVDLLCLENSSEVLYRMPLILYCSLVLLSNSYQVLEQRQFSTASFVYEQGSVAFIGYTEFFFLVSKIKPWDNITAWPIKIGLTCRVQSTTGTIHGMC